MTLGAVGSPRRTDPQQRRYPRRVTSPADKLPIKMLNDRLLVRIGRDDGERRSSGGILIPATAQMSKRLIWAEVVALGQNVRVAEVGDLVLFSPDDEGTVDQIFAFSEPAALGWNVTVEPDGGSEEPTGEVIASGSFG